jgi:hypothetical protein
MNLIIIPSLSNATLCLKIIESVLLLLIIQKKGE